MVRQETTKNHTLILLTLLKKAYHARDRISSFKQFSDGTQVRFHHCLESFTFAISLHSSANICRNEATGAFYVEQGV